MITQIGIVAGDIWHYLDEHQEAHLSELVEKLGRDKNIILMSLGWLAREGHICTEKKGDDYIIQLRK